MIGGLLLLLILVMVAGLAYRDKQKTNRLLNEQQAEIKRINNGLEMIVKERTDALESANSELNQLLYRTSHDLRTPITKIIGLLELAKSETMPKDAALEYINDTMYLLNQQNVSICEIGSIRHHSPAPAKIDLRDAFEAVIEEL